MKSKKIKYFMIETNGGATSIMKPIKDKSKYLTFKSFAKKNREAGVWPDSYPPLRSLRDKSPPNGFGEAFVRIGDRYFIDEEKFWEAMETNYKGKGYKKYPIYHMRINNG